MRPDGLPALPGDPHTLTAAEVAAALDVDAGRGLSSEEAAERLRSYGPNRLAEGEQRGLLQMLLDQLRDLVIWVLLAAAVLAVALGEAVDALVILAIVVLNAALGVIQERKAERSLEALRRLAAPLARVVRDGVKQELPAPELVPGDVVVLETGDYLAADLRLVESVALRVEEASLTGESEPIAKDAAALVAAQAPLGDRLCLGFSGTAVVGGRGRGIVVATGLRTEIGRIATMLSGIEREKTPLQERLEKLGKQLSALVLLVCAVIFLAGTLRGLPWLELLLTAVSLAVAAIPEGLPAVVTIVLALGMHNLVKRNAIVRRLRAVEALGSTTVICTDKTGTLTQNRMTVRRFHLPGRSGVLEEGGRAFVVDGRGLDPEADPDLRRLLEIAVLCNDALLQEGDSPDLGDPTELALLRAAAGAGLHRRDVERDYPRTGEFAFDADRKRMTTLHESAGGLLAMVKGAPDVVAALCDRISVEGRVRPLTEEDRERIRGANEEMARRALRVLAFAWRPLDDPAEAATVEAVETKLIFSGLLGMSDPPRPEAFESIRICRRAGIRPVMITGDYPNTALAVARELELAGDEDTVLAGAELSALSDAELRERAGSVAVYARVSPADKLRIVQAYQARGEITAMTGDGVNDAPALKQADIGVAMGRTGTDVARGASDIVLTDDNFASIVGAVEEGRGIFDNIRKFVYYLLSCNVSEVLTLLVALLAGLPRPLLPTQLLWVNLVTDGLPALALGVEPKEPGIMERPPRRPSEGVLNAVTVSRIFVHGGFITISVLAAFTYGLYSHCLAPAGLEGMDALRHALSADTWRRPEFAEGIVKAQTLAFGNLAFCQLAHALNCRSETHSIFRLGLWSNRPLVGAILLSLAVQFLVLYVGPLQKIFHTVAITGRDVVVATLLSVSPLAFGELYKLVSRSCARAG